MCVFYPRSLFYTVEFNSRCFATSIFRVLHTTGIDINTTCVGEHTHIIGI